MKQTRIPIAKEYEKRKQALETETEKQTTLENARMCKKRKRGSEENEGQKMKKNYKKLKRAKVHVSCADEQARQNLNQEDYLKILDKKNSGIEEQCWAKASINKFHKSVQYTVYQCT
jgi:hypothetical protein